MTKIHNKNKELKRGDIFYVDLGDVIGSEQGGIRPVVVIQNDIGNKYSPTTIVAPISTKFKKVGQMPTHVVLKSDEVNNLPRNSVALLEQVRTIDKKRLQEKIGKLEDPDVLNKAIRISLGL